MGIAVIFMHGKTYIIPTENLIQINFTKKTTKNAQTLHSTKCWQTL